MSSDPDPVVLMTGASGFMGRYLRDALENKDYSIVILGRSNCKKAMHIQADLTKPRNLSLEDLNIKYVVHAAGKAHIVPKTKAENVSFHQVNVEGTKNLLDALSKLPDTPKAFVLISSVAVYGLSSGTMINEDHPLEASDPYGRSKILAETFVSQWGREVGVPITILRLPLVAGINPPGNLGDMIRAIKRGSYFTIGDGSVRRSWVWAADVAGVIPKVFSTEGIFNLTDGYHPSFAELGDGLSILARKGPVKRLPLKLAWFLANIGKSLQTIGWKGFPFDMNRLQKMTQAFTFSDQKARSILGWNPTVIIENLKTVFGDISDLDQLSEKEHL